MKRIWLWIATLSIMSPLQAQQKAEDRRPSRTIFVPSSKAWDFALATGAGFGTYSSKATDSKSFGGIALVGDALSDTLFDSSTVYLRLTALLDLQNRQIVRKGLGLGQSFYLVGGKKRSIDRLKIGTIVATDRHTLSIPVRITQNFFSASPLTAGAKELDGTTLNLESGLAYAWNWDGTTSLGFELGITLMSLSNSVERAKEATTEVLFSSRRYL